MVATDGGAATIDVFSAVTMRSTAGGSAVRGLLGCAPSTRRPASLASAVACSAAKPPAHCATRSREYVRRSYCRPSTVFTAQNASSAVEPAASLAPSAPSRGIATKTRKLLLGTWGHGHRLPAQSLARAADGAHTG